MAKKINLKNRWPIDKSNKYLDIFSHNLINRYAMRFVLLMTWNERSININRLRSESMYYYYIIKTPRPNVKKIIFDIPKIIYYFLFK